MNRFLRQHKQYLLTGVSYVIPMIACGGILIVTAIAINTVKQLTEGTGTVE